MQFRDLKKQYQHLKPRIDAAIEEVLVGANYISGTQVRELEKCLADYVGVKHCITCANGTDALEIALIAMGVKRGDAVFVPDFTFFASAEAPARLGAIPVFVDVEEETYNISASSLETAIKKILEEGMYLPKVIITVDLFGLTADYIKIKEIADKYGMLVLEDSAQGFGGEYFGKKACGFGDIATTSFFPAKPLGCYGDGGAIFTDNDYYAEMIRSLCVHGKGMDKYHNVRIGTNSRLDTIQAAVLLEKLKAFQEYEITDVNRVAEYYTTKLVNVVRVPRIPQGYVSSWAQYTILTKNEQERDSLQRYLKEQNIPTNVYYPIPMHEQTAFGKEYREYGNSVTEKLCHRVLALPIGPYIAMEEVDFVCEKINEFYREH